MTDADQTKGLSQNAKYQAGEAAPVPFYDAFTVQMEAAKPFFD